MPDYIVPLLYVMIGLASIGLVLGLISLISKVSATLLADAALTDDQRAAGILFCALGR